MIKFRTLAAVLMLAGPAWVFAAGAGVQLDKANIDPTNKESLQRGARLFVNYCLSCHAAGLMRYERIGKDLGIDEKLVSENLMFTGGKVGELMTVATSAEDAKEYFGTVPPDLSVIARARGVDWLYTYMRSFYRDDSKIVGVNNLVFPDVGMPHVLLELQGMQECAAAGVMDVNEVGAGRDRQQERFHGESDEGADRGDLADQAVEAETERQGQGDPGELAVAQGQVGDAHGCQTDGHELQPAEALLEKDDAQQHVAREHDVVDRGSAHGIAIAHGGKADFSR